jgi:hypothetical protein
VLLKAACLQIHDKFMKILKTYFKRKILRIELRKELKGSNLLIENGANTIQVNY